MYTQLPVQNQKIYVLQNVQNPNALLYQTQVQYPIQYNNRVGNQVQMVIPNDKRKTYTPGQIKKGQMAYQIVQQPIQGQPIPQQHIHGQPIPQQPIQAQPIPQNPTQGQPIPQQPVPGQPIPKKPIQGLAIPQQPVPKDQSKGIKKMVYSQGHPFQNQQNQLPMKTNHHQTNNPTQIIPQTQQLQPQPQLQIQQPKNNDSNFKKKASLMTIKSLSDIPYTEYPKAEYSHKPFYNIAGYGANSYNGKVRSYNEDRTKAIVNFQKTIIANGKKITPHISYFGVFDGHGGKGCSDFLRDNLHNFLFNSQYFPAYPLQAIKEAFIIAENEFYKKAYDSQRNMLIDRSGSCALVMLIINDILYAINLGDCRALFSTDSGANLMQITRDHKPNDSIEKVRIERSGAKVYYANKVNVNGKEVELKEKDYGEGFTFPYRIAPGGISVSFLNLIIWLFRFQELLEIII